jgi:hypothetical protein
VTIRNIRNVLLVSIVFSCTPAPSLARAAQDAQAARAGLPHNIRVSPMLRPVFAMLLQKSETFRRQCERIGRARHVRVFVTSTPPFREHSLPRARASIARHLHGLMKAVVEIPVSPQMVELLPHELEHVIEQIEGVNLARLAGLGAAGVLEVDPGTFETMRARSAGLAVMRELFGETDPALASAARRVTRALRLIRPAAAPPSTAARLMRR